MGAWVFKKSKRWPPLSRRLATSRWGKGTGGERGKRNGGKKKIQNEYSTRLYVTSRPRYIITRHGTLPISYKAYIWTRVNRLMTQGTSHARSCCTLPYLGLSFTYIIKMYSGIFISEGCTSFNSLTHLWHLPQRLFPSVFKYHYVTWHQYAFPYLYFRMSFPVFLPSPANADVSVSFLLF